jgi:hypothetical protein
MDQTATRRVIRIDAIYDIETEDWTRSGKIVFVCGGLWTRKDGYRVFRYERMHEFADAIYRQGGHVWGHFAGRFDHQWLLSVLLGKYDCVPTEIIPVGSRIIKAVFDSETVLLDSFALAPISLAKFTKSQGISKKEFPLDCICGKACKGYCALKRNMSSEQWRLVLDYLESDVLSLRDALENLQTYASRYDIDLGPTIGGASWRTAKRWLDLPDSPYRKSPDLWSFANAGSYGGICEKYKWGPQPLLKDYDVCSMYPSALKENALPVGNPIMRYGGRARRSFDEGRPGFYRASVTVSDDTHLPILPARFGENSSIYYPTGTFTGIWSLPELSYAMELGYGIRILMGQVFMGEQHIFGPWVDKLWKLRAQCRNPAHAEYVGLKACHTCRKDPIGEWLKFLYNSLTGKFGSRCEHEKWLIDLDDPKKCLCQCARCEKLPRECKCAYYKPPKECRCRPKPDVKIGDRIWSRTRIAVDDCAHKHWYAYLTAHSRNKTRRFQLADGDGGLSSVYTDTDNLKFNASNLSREHAMRDMIVHPDTPFDDTIGKWEFQGILRDFYAIAPKVYSGYYVEDGKLAIAAKGINVPEGQIPVIGQTYTREGPIGLREGLHAGHLFDSAKTTRMIWERYGDRIPIADGFTRPYTYNEAQEYDDLGPIKRELWLAGKSAA